MQKGKEAKPHIGIYGRRNAGKSSLINRLAGQDIAIVSEVAGTTTDPVKKSFEITGFGPVVLIDTAGADDSGELGEKRINKTIGTINTIDLAILLITNNLFDNFELELIKEFKSKDVPYFIIHNKSDIEPLSSKTRSDLEQKINCNIIEFSNITNKSIDELHR